MNSTLLVRRSSVLLFALLSSCTTRRHVPEPPRPQFAHFAPSARAVMQIEADGVGPIRLGMTSAEIEALPNLTSLPAELLLEGERMPALVVMREGRALATVELVDDRAFRIRIESEAVATERGARVGMTARELQQIDGPGRVLKGEGNVCAIFAKEPGLSFCFQTDYPSVDSWTRLVHDGVEVATIFVIGMEP